MKSVLLTSLNRKRRQAMALILVIITVALLSMLIVAIFSVTRTEYKATQSYVAAKSAKQLGDSAVAIVEAQIQNAQNTATGNARTTHATQPGMVRVYQSNGGFEAAYKLYSSSTMKVTGDEASLYSDTHVPPSTWHTMPARYIDLNEPVVRPALSATGATSLASYAVYFPIIDPRASWNYSGSQSAEAQGEVTTQVEGFSYTKVAPSIGGGGGQDYSTKVVTNADASTPDTLRLPMPVEWMYVLQDGTLGVLDASNKFIAATGAGDGTPSATNPMVGRVAFWTDDESCKININTAAEPTFMSTPFYYHERDAKWAHFPPATGEYQRYPGHPATVALSAVLAPNYLLDPMLPSTDGLGKAMDVVDIKEQIYNFAPKIAGGGSEGGTRPFVRDDFSSDKGEREASLKINLDQAVKERLYASVDEMLFKDLDYNTSTGRSPAILTLPNGSGNFFAHDRLEHSRFFLTAHSRSPEFSIHGLPRVCMWPVADESKGANHRTSFDNAIALCATIKKDSASSNSTTRSYFFRRANSRNSTADVNLSRNGLLLDYLTTQMSNLQYPATSYSATTSKDTFKSKYGEDNVNQMAIQFFDYIRCTNLYDGIMARKNDASAASGQGASAQYTYRDSNEANFYTYTMARITDPPTTVNNVTAEQGQSNRRSSAQGILPGHGQVSPAIWRKGSRSYKGFGRMFTISEIGFQFMCTADGNPNDTLIAPNVSLLQKFGQGRTEGDPNRGSGGLTARRYDAGTDTTRHPTAKSAYGSDENGAFVPEIDADQDGIAEAYWWSNLPPLINPDGSNTYAQEAIAYYGCSAEEGSELHPYRHPGFNPANWNMTLAQGTPLTINQKRIQVMLSLEAFCPSLGWTGMYPEYTIVLDGATVSQMKVVGYKADGTLTDQPLFNTSGAMILKSNGNLYSAYDCHASGGHATPSAFAGGRQNRGISNGGGVVSMPADASYDDNNTSGHQALANFQFASDFITVDRNSPLKVTFPSQEIAIKIYDTHNWETAQPVQILNVSFANVPSSEVPMPSLPQSKEYSETQNTNGRIDYTRAQQGPHFWCANYNGCIGLMRGRFNPQYTDGGDQPMWLEPPTRRPLAIVGDAAGGNAAQTIRGRLDTSGALISDARADAHARGLSIIAEGDVVRSLVPAIGDYRTLAAMYDVPASWWRPHPLWKTNLSELKMAHSFTGFWATSETGAKIALAYRSPVQKDMPEPAYNDSYRSDFQLVGGARFDLDSKDNAIKDLHRGNGDLPPDEDYASAANAFGDFDAGVTSAREGPYINKPDEGNFFAGNQTISGQTKYWRSAYFYETYENTDDWRSGIYITPNRLISSPVMFGSLPTGVFGTSSLPKATDRASSLGSLDFAPWQTLLFRPHAQISSAAPSSNASHPGLQDPSDHYLLDLFFMPVVEPYAISEPLSVAGRINMNYQIMPFINIRRATAMHAVMKGEYITAVPSKQIVAAKNYYPGNAIAWNERFWNDTQDRRYWHRPIDPRSTLRQFDLKFGHRSGGSANYQGLFRSASQICEMHLIPKIVNNGVGITNPDDMSNASSQSAINSTMNAFWGANRVTGDNVRERPYSNLYPRLTTRSNTFRVHVRAQILRKARSTAADTFDTDKDAINGEYRGSYLIERFIDPNDPTVTIPDYVSNVSQAPLDSFYRFRTLETKRFNP